jgi:Lrp/AsnC family transcriptional regulator
MDKLDREILELLQQDGSLTAAEIADRIGLSKVPCWRRIRRMQESGVIRRTVALLEPKALNVGTTVYLMMRTGNHSAAWLEKFMKAVRDVPEVTEIYRMSGDVDYLVRMAVPDIAGYDAVYKRLIKSIDFLDVSASFVLETIKSTTELPLHYVRD